MYFIIKKYLSLRYGAVWCLILNLIVRCSSGVVEPAYIYNMKNFILMALFASAGMVLAAVLPTAHTGYIGISTGALILFGGGVSELRGSIGGTTFSRNSSGAYARNRTKPVNPNTTKQSNMRALFATIAQSWRTLTNSQRITWNSLAPTFPRVNRLGQTVPLTGFQLFQKCNTNNIVCGHAFVNVIESVDTPNIQYIDSVTVDRSANTMIISAEDATVNTDTSFRVYATAPRSAGSKFAGPSEYKLIHVEPADNDLNTMDLHASYIAVFGDSYPVGAVIGFKFDSVSLITGINNASQSLQSVVVA